MYFERIMVKIKNGVNCLEPNILWGFARETYRTHSSQTSCIYETCVTTKKHRHNATSTVTALAPGGNVQVIILIPLLTYILNFNIDNISGMAFL